jgi:glycogen synthase
MKLLLVGPVPPPHGGVSVHVARVREELRSAGIPCRILNTARKSSPSEDYIAVSSRVQLATEVACHALRGWTVHVHTNGHNRRGWILSLLCGIAAKTAQASVLTLHSGLTPQYLDAAGKVGREIAARTCLAYRRVICVNRSIAGHISALGVRRDRLAVLPAFLGTAGADAALPDHLSGWMTSRCPLLCAVLSFRPEYGFGVLIEAVVRLRSTHPRLGVLVLGDGEHRQQAGRLVLQSGNQGAVHLAGDVSHSVCVAAMARSDLVVRPTFADGDAISVREALALGKPVVASDAIPRPEGVTLFRTGDASDLASAVETALLLRGSASPSVSDRTTNRIEQLIEIYEQVAG